MGKEESGRHDIIIKFHVRKVIGTTKDPASPSSIRPFSNPWDLPPEAVTCQCISFVAKIRPECHLQMKLVLVDLLLAAKNLEGHCILLHSLDLRDKLKLWKQVHPLSWVHFEAMLDIGCKTWNAPFGFLVLFSPKTDKRRMYHLE